MEWGIVEKMDRWTKVHQHNLIWGDCLLSWSGVHIVITSFVRDLFEAVFSLIIECFQTFLCVSAVQILTYLVTVHWRRRKRWKYFTWTFMFTYELITITYIITSKVMRNDDSWGSVKLMNNRSICKLEIFPVIKSITTFAIK